MQRGALRLWVAALVLCCVTRSATAQDKAAEDLLKSKRLTRVGTTYLLEGDVKLPDALRTVRLARKQCDDYAKARADIGKQIDQAEGAIERLRREYDELKARLPQPSDAKYNVMVRMVNSRVEQMREGALYIEERTHALEELVDPRNLWIARMEEASDQMEATATRYQSLAADADVTAALAQLNAAAKTGARWKLGPSPQFTRELAAVRRDRQAIQTAVVKLLPGYTTPNVQTTLNGDVTQPMTIDSGASFVTLPWDLAKRLGLTPAGGDPGIPLTLADGKTVEGKLMILRSIRVGQFEANNVPCVVMPASTKAAPLLGTTFLRNFVYRMDMTSGELHMTRAVFKPDAATAPATRSTTAPTAPPLREIIVEVLIDGDSTLHVTPTGIYWKSHGVAKPGRHNGANRPTYVNGVPWKPVWQKPGDRGTDTSDPLPLNVGTDLNFAVETLACGTEYGTTEHQARDPVTWANVGGEFVVTIPDRQVDSRWYRLRIAHKYDPARH